MKSGMLCASCLIVSALEVGAQAPRPSAQIPAAALYKIEDSFFEWPLAPRDKAYAAIDGRRLHQSVADLTAISRKYRDDGHPQFWGRIIGTSADAQTAQWMVEKFNKFGLSDV